jgi:hypothetical protein
MTATYLHTLFSAEVKAAQTRNGSRAAYAAADDAPAGPDALGPREADFLAARDSFYLATVGHQGWPYLQHRGGPRGFVHVLDDRTIGFADLRGNRQYLSLGNLAGDDRVALFFMDYAQRARLKLLGHARAVPLAEAGALATPLSQGHPAARIERLILIRIAAFDWNCPRYITPRYTGEEVAALIAPLTRRIAELEAAAAAVPR